MWSFFVGQNNTVCPLSSKRKILHRVSCGVLSAETSDMVNALEIAYFLSNALLEILFLTIFQKNYTLGH